MRFAFASLCACLCTLLAFMISPTPVQCSGAEIFTLRVLPGQQAVAIGDDQGRDLMESGRFSKYACTSLDGPDCGMVNGHSKTDIAQILASMLEMIGSSRKASASDQDQDSTSASTSTSTSTSSSSSSSSSSTQTSTEASAQRKQTQTDAQEDEDGATTLSADQLSALKAALTKQLQELLGAHLSSDSDSDTDADGSSGDGEGDSDGSNEADEPHIEMQIVDGDVDLSQVGQDGTSVHAFTIGADGETHAITPEELKQLLRAARRMKQNIKGATIGSEEGDDDSDPQSQQEHDRDDDTDTQDGPETHARSARPTRMTPEQMRHAREQQQEADREEPR